MIRVKRCRYGDMAYPSGDQYVGKSLDLYGDYSEAEVVLFRHLLKPGFTVLEIGANLGAHTVPLAQMVGPAGQVHAFEPQRVIYYLLCANIVLNHLTNVICHQAAVAELAGRIQVPELDYGRNLNFGGIDLETPYVGRTYEVPVIRVDDLRLTRCDLIKIDVEGMEKRVLEGAVSTIAEFKPLLYLEDDRGGKSAALRDFLKALGYDLYPHLPHLYDRDNFAGNPADAFPNTVSKNLLCRHQESPVTFHPGDPALADLQDPFAQGCIEEGNTQLHRGLLDEAAAAFRQALRWQPRSADAQHNLGVVAEGQGRLAQASASYQRALEIQPDRTDSANGLGSIGNTYLVQNNLAEAIDCYRQVLRFQPENTLAHNNLGIALAAQGCLDEAVASFEEAIRLQHDYADAHRNLAIILARQGGK